MHSLLATLRPRCCQPCGLQPLAGQAIVAIAELPTLIAGMPRPPAEKNAFEQLKQELLDEMRSAIKIAHDENYEKNRLLIQGQEISLQKMIVQTLSQRSELMYKVAGLPGPEQVPERELQSDAQIAEVVEGGEMGEPPPVVVATITEKTAQTSETKKAPMDRGSTWISENQTTQKKAINLADYRHSEGFFIRIVDSHAFQFSSFFMILANAIYIGVEADWNPEKNIANYSWGYLLAEHGFCLFFTGELVARFFTYRLKKDAFKDNWFVFDFVMVLMMVIDTWILGLVLSAAGDSTSSDTGAVGGVGRLLRLLRLIRISRLMKLIPELVTMAKGMVAAIRAVHAALLILFILVYVFAIIMASLVGEEELVQEYFPTVRTSMVTLLVNAVFLDDFSALVNTMLELGKPLPLILLAVFVLLSALTVMNMLIGVLCQVVLDVSAEEEESHVKAQMAKSLLVMLEELDDDKSGQLSKAEVQDVISEPEAIAIMKDIQVDTNHLLDLTDMLYPSEEGSLEIPTFMNILLALRGKRQVTMNDLAKSNNFTMWALERQLGQHREIITQNIVEALNISQTANAGLIDGHAKTVKEYSDNLVRMHQTVQSSHRQTAHSAGIY